MFCLGCDWSALERLDGFNSLTPFLPFPLPVVDYSAFSLGPFAQRIGILVRKAANRATSLSVPRVQSLSSNHLHPLALFKLKVFLTSIFSAAFDPPAPFFLLLSIACVIGKSLPILGSGFFLVSSLQGSYPVFSVFYVGRSSPPPLHWIFFFPLFPFPF